MTNGDYKLVNRTPEDMQCVAIGCPSIYEVTPKNMKCGILAGCESIYADAEGNTYLIVGKQVNPEEFGLAKKVGEGEILIQVPKNLIDKMQRG